MAIDPMSLVQAVRPGPAIDIGTPDPGALRRGGEGSPIVDHAGNQRSLGDLQVRPGTAGYAQRIQPPPCATCAEDHNPLKEAQGLYGHPYKRPGDEDQVTDDVMTMVVPASSVAVPAPGIPPVAVTQRVNIMPGRGDDAFIVAIEEAPDWDLIDSWKLTGEQLLPMLPILRKLNVKIRDNTAGDLKSLELERAGH